MIKKIPAQNLVYKNIHQKNISSKIELENIKEAIYKLRKCRIYIDKLIIKFEKILERELRK